METTPTTPGVLEGLDRFLALNPSPATQAAVVALKGDYAARAAHEARLRSAKEEFQAAEAALLAHGSPHEPSAVVEEEILLDMDLRLEKMKAARRKFREAKMLRPRDEGFARRKRQAVRAKAKRRRNRARAVRSADLRSV